MRRYPSPPWREACLSTGLLSSFWTGEAVILLYFLQVRRRLWTSAGRDCVDMTKAPFLLSQTRHKVSAGRHWETRERRGLLWLACSYGHLAKWHPFLRIGEVKPLSSGQAGCVHVCIHSPSTAPSPLRALWGPPLINFSGFETPGREGLGAGMHFRCPGLPCLFIVGKGKEMTVSSPSRTLQTTETNATKIQCDSYVLFLFNDSF